VAELAVPAAGAIAPSPEAIVPAALVLQRSHEDGSGSSDPRALGTDAPISTGDAPPPYDRRPQRKRKATVVLNVTQDAARSGQYYDSRAGSASNGAGDGREDGGQNRRGGNVPAVAPQPAPLQPPSGPHTLGRGDVPPTNAVLQQVAREREARPPPVASAAMAPPPASNRAKRSMTMADFVSEYDYQCLDCGGRATPDNPLIRCFYAESKNCPKAWHQKGCAGGKLAKHPRYVCCQEHHLLFHNEFSHLPRPPNYVCPDCTDATLPPIPPPPS